LDKKEEILKTALDLFVESGFYATPTSKIAKEAGVANGTLFHYFKTKEELITVLYTEHQNRFTDYVNKNTIKDESFKHIFHSFFTSTFNWINDNKSAFQFIQQFTLSPFNQLISQEYIIKKDSLLVQLLQQGIKEGIFKKLPLELLCTLFNSHIIGTNTYLSKLDLPAEQSNIIIHQSFPPLWDMISI
jgi:AcrR family transcriptional regulator